MKIQKSRKTKKTKQLHLHIAAVCVVSAGLAASSVATGPDDRSVPASGQIDSLPSVNFPAENPYSEEKRILGKILYWDEQLSSDNTMACATCHILGAGGADPRSVRNPGVDGIFQTDDDVFASPGVVRQDANDEYERDASFGFMPQVTGRLAPSVINAAFHFEQFWDGRAGSTFIDPITNQQMIASGGSLESQAVGPPGSSVEMAHAGRDWDMISAKIRNVSPLAMATNVQADVQAELAIHSTYPSLFNAAFGDAQVNATRIAFAIATYERTLIADQTPWDEFIAGNPSALTPVQQNGWGLFQSAQCTLCHPAPLFTDDDFHNIGLRAPGDDTGRQQVTNNPADARKFKTPGLRNLALRESFMHTGEHNSVLETVLFYSDSSQWHMQNIDPFMAAINIPPPPSVGAITQFLEGGLLDPRVANSQFPFDELTLHSQVPGAHVNMLMQPRPGTGGIVPQMLRNNPPNIGNEGFKIGLHHGLGGATARVLYSTVAPTGNVLVPQQVLGPVTLNETGAGNGYATMHWPIPYEPTLNGTTMYMQWEIDDAGAAGGKAYTRIAEFTLFCGPAGCPEAPCFADCDGNGTLNILDYICFGDAYAIGSAWADCDSSGTLNILDYICFGDAYAAGCP